VKNPRMWKDVNKIDDKAILIQRVWRGFYIRDWLKQCGPGVLKRSVCHNDEELVTIEEKDRVNPLDYFAFEENKKIYWFDIKTISEICTTDLVPKNPYTREPLSIETRQRLRKLRKLRYFNNLENSYSKTIDVNKILSDRWLNICQIIEENGFFEMSPLFFTSLNRTQLLVFNEILLRDLIAWSAEHKDKTSKRHQCVIKFKMFIIRFKAQMDITKCHIMTSFVLINFLYNFTNNFDICYMIMSAMRRI
jgi:hypothetical protein